MGFLSRRYAAKHRVFEVPHQGTIVSSFKADFAMALMGLTFATDRAACDIKNQ